MSKFESLKNSRQFQTVYSKKCSRGNKYLVMYIIENGLDRNRFGISVSKKVGNSVVRHRTTRLIRESYRLNQESLKKGYDIVIVGRQSDVGCDFFTIEKSFLHLCKLHHLIAFSE